MSVGRHEKTFFAKTCESIEKSMLFKACVFKKLLFALGKVHIPKMHFFIWASSFKNCVFHHLWGSLGAHFRFLGKLQ